MNEHKEKAAEKAYFVLNQLEELVRGFNTVRNYEMAQHLWTLRTSLFHSLNVITDTNAHLSIAEISPQRVFIVIGPDLQIQGVFLCAEEAEEYRRDRTTEEEKFYIECHEIQSPECRNE